MKGANMLLHLRDAIQKLQPQEVRQAAAIPVSVELNGTTDESYRQMERFFARKEFSPGKRAESTQIIFRSGTAPGPALIRIFETGLAKPPDAFYFQKDDPMQTVREVLGAREELGLALARNLPVFRGPVVLDVIQTVAKENALFSIATAVPSIMPLVSLPWAVGEFASDTAFLTLNQLRMAFMLAAASDREVGFREQKAEIASLVASAFGWRALARELVGKIPMGGGLIPKAAVAYAGTFVAGLSLERYYNIGYGLNETERKTAYSEAYESGKHVAQSLVKAYTSLRNAS